MIPYLIATVVVLVAFFLGRIVIKSVPDELEYTQSLIVIRDVAFFVAMTLVAGTLGFFLVVIAFVVLGFRQFDKSIPLFVLALIIISPTPIVITLASLGAYIQGLLSVFPEKKTARK